ncbi:hypothetical protein [uncultured Gimesia sp.]|uniref:hypothetical protein n=1 Tax=uncultured Gimesia sp. TaxID=1678688 RepID=UPI0030DA9C68|tara:strand:+ start:40751 stop:41116 length:366 start_codon:yes stop_codon:yes gene_type:complete
MKYVLLFTILIAGCADKAAEKAAEKEVKQAEVDSTVALGEASAVDLSTADLPVPENMKVDSAALETIKAKLDCEKCGIKRDDKFESKTSLRYDVDCDEIKYIVTYDPEKNEVLESKPVESK